MKIPDYINITEKDNCLIAKDTRTNFAAKVKFEKEAIKIYGEEYRNSVIGNLIHKLEEKYNKSLPIEERKGTNTPTDFTCPYCLTKDKPEIIKKPRIGTYRAGIWYARSEYINVDLQNVYKCKVCKNQFTQDELNNKRFEVDKTNKRVMLFEQLEDKIITNEEYQDKKFEIEMGMTKTEYEMKKAKEDKEDRQYTRFHFSTKDYFILIAIGFVIAIILSIIYPQPNPCEKYGDDWEYDVGDKYVRSACINSNGDIKYIQ
jgi:DNA-directed RNA polymerase subunit RPC12/RpoP